MFNANFYPTPSALVHKMIAPFKKQFGGRDYLSGYRTILEPSAGKGDIADVLVDDCYIKKDQISCIEIEPELRMILQGKGYAVIETDFLAYADRLIFDLIIMNPPFDTGADHLLKAWEILQAGDIVCLLNAETILNPHTEKRRLLCRIISEHGRYEVIGNAFASAERKTDVNVAIVWLHKDKPASPFPDFTPTGMDFDAEVKEETFTSNPIASRNIVDSLVAQYNEASRILTEMATLEKQYRFYTASIIKKDSDEVDKSLNEKLTELKKRFWMYIFQKTNLGKVTTSNFRQKFEDFSTSTQRLSFTVANVMEVLEMFFFNHDAIMQDCIEAVFKKATSYHEKNKVHVEGWKTNKSYRVNKKIIVPYGIKYDQFGFALTFMYSTKDFYDDLDKALCFLTGRKLDAITTIQSAIERHIGHKPSYREGDYEGATFEERYDKYKAAHHVREWDEVFPSEFFNIRIFKKGTVHLTFRDPEHCALLNIAASQGKKEVGGGY